MKPAHIAACLALASSCHAAAGADLGKVGQVENVSIVALIANPDRYDGKQVRASGAIRVEFEGNAICLHQEDLEQRIHANCLWIDPDLQALKTDIPTLKALTGQYVLVEGTFRKDRRGHMGMYAGAVTGLWRVKTLGRPNAVAVAGAAP